MSPAARKTTKKVVKKNSSSSITANKEASEAWNILAALRRPFANRDTKWPTRRRVRNREEDPPVPEAYGGTALMHKPLTLDTLIPTPTGWSTMGELQVGDYVFSEAGLPVKVIATTPIFYDQPVYAITFDDGSIIKAEECHYWYVEDEEGIGYKLDTKTLANNYLRRSNGKNLVSKYSIPNAQPLQLPELRVAKHRFGKGTYVNKNRKPREIETYDLPVAPYTLGVWLGDGNRNNGHFFTQDEEVLQGVEDDGYKPRASSYQKGAYTTTGLQHALRVAGLLKNKHIPAIYLRASYEQRLALLQGLMDTDGSCSAGGEFSFVNTNSVIIEGISELLHTFGIKHTIRWRADNRKESYKDRAIILGSTTLPIFRIQRKLERQKEKLIKSIRQYIKKIELIESEPTRCITVDSATHMILVGKSMIMSSQSFELDHMVRQIVALLGENKEQYVFYAPVETEEMYQLADLTQQSVSALMELLSDFHPIERPRPLVHDYQTAQGLAVSKLSFNWDFFKKVINTKSKEEDWQTAFTRYIKEKRELPIRKTIIDPLTCYWEFDVNGLVAVAEYGRARRSALRDTYKEETHILNAISRIPISDNTNYSTGVITAGATTYQDTGDLVTIIELWTRTEFFLLAEVDDSDERQVLVRQKHPFGRPPYFFAAGVLTGDNDPLYKFQPLVSPMYQTTMELSMVRTARFNAAYLSSFKPFYIQYDGGGAEMDEESGGLKVHFLMPGNQIPSIKGGRIVPIDWTNLDELVSVEQSLMADRDRFGFQAILAGNSAASGESTAWATRMLRDQGMIQFNGVLRNYAQMLEEEIRFLMFLVSDVLKMDLPITRRVFDQKTNRGTIKTLKLTPEMCTVGFDVHVKLNAGRAADRIAIVEEFRRAHEAGEVPLRMVLEEGWGFQNATQVMEERIDEDIQKQMIPKAIEIIFQVGVSGALDILAKELPQTPIPNPTEMPPPLPPQQPPGGEIPGGVVEPGMGQGLIPPQLPPEAPGNVPLPVGP